MWNKNTHIGFIDSIYFLFSGMVLVLQSMIFNIFVFVCEYCLTLFDKLYLIKLLIAVLYT